MPDGKTEETKPPTEAMDAVLALCKTLTESLATIVQSSGDAGTGIRSVGRYADTSKTVPIFAGGSVVQSERWLRQLESARMTGNWTDTYTMGIILRKLSGEALDWHESNALRCETFAEWKQEFLSSFLTPETRLELIEAFTRSFQKRGESIGTFARRVERLGNQCDMGFVDMKRQILKGILPEHKKFAPFLNAQVHAKLNELIRDIDDSIVLDGGSKPRFGSWQNFSSTRGSRYDERRTAGCFRCSEPGHKSFECPHDRRDGDQGSQRSNGSRFSRRQSEESNRTGDDSTAMKGAGFGEKTERSSGERIATDRNTNSQLDNTVRRGGGGCFRCGKLGHISRFCTNIRTVETRRKATVDFEQAAYDSELSDIQINHQNWIAQIDSGADTNIISEAVANKLNLRIGPTELEYIAGYTGAGCKPLGEAKVILKMDGMVFEKVPFTVVPSEMWKHPEVLIGKTVLNSGLVTVTCCGNTWLLEKEGFAKIAKAVLARDDPRVVTTLSRLSEDNLNLTVMSKVNLKARSINFVRAETTDKRRGVLCVKSESSIETLHEITEGGCVMPVANYGEEDIMLREGTVIARGRRLEDSDEYFRAQMQSSGVLKTESTAAEQIRIDDIQVGENTPPRYRLALWELLNKYRGVVATSMKELGRTHLTEFNIKEVPGSGPVRSKPFRMSVMEKAALKEILLQMKEANMITESHSAYASPTMLVRKPDNSWRMVIDFRKLNAQTVKENYPLPLVEDVLDETGGRKIYSTLDLAWGYFQIPMAKEAAEKAAFVTPDGHYQPTVLLMGLTGAPSCFQELMMKVRASTGNKQVHPFLDDLIAAADDYQEHMKQIEDILEALRKAGLTIKLSKCKFFMETVEFLGFKVSKEGVQPGSRKAAAVQEFPKPKNIHEVRMFLGLTGFFRRFVRNYASIAEPLTALLRKSRKFEWNERCEEAFKSLKDILSKEPILKRFDPTKETQLHVDASTLGLGAILLQKFDGKFHMIYAVSRKLSESEIHYHSTKLEQLAVVWALTRLRHYLHGIKFTVVSDCSAVAALKSLNGTPQLARWFNKIAEFNFEVKHRAGTSMEHVDALSRMPMDGFQEGEEEDLPTDLKSDVIKIHRVVTQRNEMFNYNEIVMVQAVDAEIKERIRILQKMKSERSVKERSIVEGFQLRNGVLYKEQNGKALFVIPKHLRRYLVVVAHDKAGHFGREKTIGIIKEFYWFPKMREYVTQHLKLCLECLFGKAESGKKEGLCQAIRPARRPFEKVFIDHLGPLPASNGCQHVIVLVDGLSKFVILEAVKTTNSAAVIKFLRRVFVQYGVPDRLVSDRGTAYTSQQFQNFLKTHLVRQILISPQHANSNGQAERMVKEVTRLLRAISEKPDKSDWALKISMAQMFLNRAPTRTTGVSPFQILHGYIPRLDGFSQVVENEQDKVWYPAAKLQEEIRKRVLESQKEYARYYDRKRREHRIRYAIGDVVLVSRLPVHTGVPVKLQPKFRGPLVVTEVLPNDTYRLIQLGLGRSYSCTAHCSQMRWYRVFGSDDVDVVPLTADDSEFPETEEDEIETADRAMMVAETEPAKKEAPQVSTVPGSEAEFRELVDKETYEEEGDVTVQEETFQTATPMDELSTLLEGWNLETGDEGVNLNTAIHESEDDSMCVQNQELTDQETSGGHEGRTRKDPQAPKKKPGPGEGAGVESQSTPLTGRQVNQRDTRLGKRPTREAQFKGKYPK